MIQNFPRRVLVVDDELLMRWSVAETLKGRGHIVIEAENGVGALHALEKLAAYIDAVVLDYRLPDTPHLLLLEQIRQIAPRTPVILMTAFGTPELVTEALNLGAYGVLEKPFDLNALEALVSRACTAAETGKADAVRTPE